MRNRAQVLTALLCLTLTGLIAPTANAQLNVVASLPTYGALAKEVGGSAVIVTSLAQGTEDAHFVNPRPSYIRVLNKTDVLIENGAEMEIGWLPPLIQASRNPKLILDLDSPTRILLAGFVDMLQVPIVPIDRSMGDLHPLGNPHFALDPNNAIVIAESLKEKFCFLKPNSCQAFTENFEAFEQTIQQKMTEWREHMKPLQGMNIVEYHRTFIYLAEAFGFRLVDELEPRPGIPPSVRHFRELIPRMQSLDVKLILIEPFHERKTPAFVSQETGAKVVLLPSATGGVPGTDTYIDLIDTIVLRLVQAATES